MRARSNGMAALVCNSSARRNSFLATSPIPSRPRHRWTHPDAHASCPSARRATQSGELALGIIPPAEENVRLDQVRSGRDDRRLTESTLCELAHDGLELADGFSGRLRGEQVRPERGATREADEGSPERTREVERRSGTRAYVVGTSLGGVEPRQRGRCERRRDPGGRPSRSTRRARHAPRATVPRAARDLRARRGSMEVGPPHLPCVHARSCPRRSRAHGQTARARRAPVRGMRSHTAPRSPREPHCHLRVAGRGARSRQPLPRRRRAR